jgi:hypothetical protein
MFIEDLSDPQVATSMPQQAVETFERFGKGLSPQWNNVPWHRPVTATKRLQHAAAAKVLPASGITLARKWSGDPQH